MTSKATKSERVTNPELESASTHSTPPQLGKNSMLLSVLPSDPAHYLIPSVKGHRGDILGSDIFHLKKESAWRSVGGHNSPHPRPCPQGQGKSSLASSPGEHLEQVSLTPGPYPPNTRIRCCLGQASRPDVAGDPSNVQPPPGHTRCVRRPVPRSTPRTPPPSRPSVPGPGAPRLPRSVRPSPRPSPSSPPAPAPPPAPPPGLRALTPRPAPCSVAALAAAPAAAAGPAECFPAWKAGPRRRPPAGQPWRQRRGGGSIRERRAARARSRAPPSCRPGGRAPARGARPRPPRDAGRAAGARLEEPGVGRGLPPESVCLALPSLRPGAWAPFPPPFLFLETPRAQAGSAAPGAPLSPGPARGQSRLWGDQSRGPRNSGWGRRAPGPRRTLRPQRTCTPGAPPPSSRGPSKRNRTWILVSIGRLTPYPKNVRMEIQETAKCVEVPLPRKNEEGLFSFGRSLLSLRGRSYWFI